MTDVSNPMRMQYLPIEVAFHVHKVYRFRSVTVMTRWFAYVLFHKQTGEMTPVVECYSGWNPVKSDHVSET